MDLDEFFKFLSPIIVGFLAAYLGSRLALKKFKEEKLWDERRSIYKEVIQAFEELHHWSEHVRASHFCEPTIEQEVKFDEPLRLISKHCISGSLFLSKSFHNKLKEANADLYSARFEVNEESRPDLDSEQGRADWLLILAQNIRTIVEAHLPNLIELASKELPN